MTAGEEDRRRTDGLKLKCCQVQGTVWGFRRVVLAEDEDEDKDESLFTACALHLTEMNCSPATSPHPAVLTWLWLRPVNDYVMNLHCNNRAGSRPSFNPLLVKTICQTLNSANWGKRGNINVTANVRVAVPVPVPVAVAFAACKVI